ncbi:hypothetical protein BJX70DRAFT_395285 [Aspergillus crustosus]
MQKLIVEMQRSLGPSQNQPFRSVWSGQLKDKNCLLDGFGITYKSSTTKEFSPCEDLAVRVKRADACPLNPPGSPVGDLPPPITWSEGDPSPTCTSNCGKLCEGYYCNPVPTGDPPSFTDPSDDPDSPSVPHLPPATKFDPAEDCIHVANALTQDDQ